MIRYRKGMSLHQVWNDCNIDVTFDFAGEEPDEDTLCLAMEGLIAQLKIEQALIATGRQDRSSIVAVADVNQGLNLRHVSDFGAPEGGPHER